MADIEFPIPINPVIRVDITDFLNNQINQFDNSRVKKIDSIKELRNLGFNYGQIQEILNYNPTFSKDWMSAREMNGQAQTLADIVSVAKDLKVQNMFDVNDYFNTLKEQNEVLHLNNNGTADKRYNNMFTEETHYDTNNVHDFVKTTGKLGLLALAIIGAGTSIGCGTEKPIDNKTYDHGVNISATDLINGNNIGANITAIRERDKAKFSGATGTRIGLGETANSLENFTIQITAGGYLLREYTNVSISENTIRTNLIPNSADVAGLLANVYPSGMNVSYEPRSVAVSYNAIEGTRLTADQKRGIHDAIEYVKAHSNGWITNTSYSEGNNDINNTNIPEGQIWGFAEKDSSSVSNATLPQGGDRVKSGRVRIGSEAVYERAFGETFDVFIQGEQNLYGCYTDGKLGDWFTIMFSRPRGNDNSYRISTDKETQKGLDSLTNNTATNQMCYVTSDGGMFNPMGGTAIEYNTDHVKPKPEMKKEIEHIPMRR